MKYAVMWASTRNLGDDIQTLAAINLLAENNIDQYFFLDRENLSSYSGPPVRLIMNGWFTTNVGAFPPPESVIPLFISFHCANPIIIKKNLNYFKKHEPIGCRDTRTVDLFLKSGIDAYFSGCLSMCFNEVKEKNDTIYAVDSAPTGYSKAVRIQHRIPNRDVGIKYSVKDRLTKANELLELYKKAKLVITSRLHCALPCRAFNTDMLFTFGSYEKDGRFSGLRKYVAKGKIKVDREIINERKEITKNLFKSLL